MTSQAVAAHVRHLWKFLHGDEGIVERPVDAVGEEDRDENGTRHKRLSVDRAHKVTVQAARTGAEK